MAELLLINPKGRTKMAKRRTAAQKRATARLVAMNKSRRRTSAKRRRNPVAAVASNPIRSRIRSVARRAARRVARRRNPISLGSAASYMTLIKDGLIGGAGAVAVDLAYGQVQGYLPASLRRTPGTVGAGDAVKALITIMAGKLLNKPTKGLSMTAAKGALTVQAHGIIAQMLPGTMTLGYASPAAVANVSNRIGPNRVGNVSRFIPKGATPLLSGSQVGEYANAGTASPLLNGRNMTMARESIVR